MPSRDRKKRTYNPFTRPIQTGKFSNKGDRTRNGRNKYAHRKLIERNKAAQQKLVHVLIVVTVKAHEEIEMVNVGNIDKTFGEINIDGLGKYFEKAI